MITLRGVTRRFLNAVMALHRRAIVREVNAATEAMRLADRRVGNQERIIQAEQATLWELRQGAIAATLDAARVQGAADAELATLIPRN